MILVIVLAVVVVVALGAVAVVGGLRGSKASNERIEGRLAELTVLRKDRATCLGRASADTAHAKGVGVLALTPDELVFWLAVPDREVRVPRAAITGSGSTRSFLDKHVAEDVLHVAWTVDGEADEAAWKVPDLTAWVAALAG